MSKETESGKPYNRRPGNLTIDIITMLMLPLCIVCLTKNFRLRAGSRW